MIKKIFYLFIISIARAMIMYAGSNSVVSPGDLTTGRQTIALDKKIHKLNIDTIPLLKLLDAMGKESTDQMEFKHLTKERMSAWGGIASFGGSWASGANKAGTIDVTSGEGWMYGAGDIIKCPNDSDTNIYVDSVSGDTLTCHTYDNSTTIDFSSSPTTGSNAIFNISNSFELGTGKGTMKMHQPSENTNYIQIVQTPFGVVETAEHIGYDAGGKEYDEQSQDKYVDHLFSLERLMFFGQKHKAASGYMSASGPKEQYFSGGFLESASENVVTESDLTQAEFGAWINDCVYYAKRPVVFAGALIFEALSYWLGQDLQTKQDETTLGIKVANYVNEYGDMVNVIPHRELFKNYYAGYAACVDLDDVKYRFLQGEDTHLEKDIQENDKKQRISEYRTWCGFQMGNAKRHGLLKGVSTISA